MKLMFPIATVITSSNVAESLYPTYNIGTSYSVGTNVYLPSNYGEYQALTANTGKDPSLNPSDWKFLGTANKYKMFDQFLNTQTIKTPIIEVDVVAYGANGLYLGNIDATEVTINVVDNDSLSTIETAYYTMYRDILDWQDYFYGSWLEEKNDAIMYERTTLSRNISFVVTMGNGANNAKCGIFFAGMIKTSGNTKWGVKIGALDYSTVVSDTSSGATYLARGNYAKKMDIDIFARTGSAKAVFNMLVSARALPIVFIGGGAYELLNVYGYIRNFDELVAGPVETVINAEIIGLI